MSSLPIGAVVSKEDSQLTVEILDLTEPRPIPAGGLGIGGITTSPELEHAESDLETEDAAQKHLQPPVENKYDSVTTPTVVQDGILMFIALDARC
jgi:hypothetical protein